MTVINDERWQAFDLDPEQREAFQKALSSAGYKVARTLNRVPHDAKGNAIDGPKVREILRAIKEGRVVPPSRPSLKKAVSPVEAAPEAPAKPKPKPAKKKAPKKAKKGGA
ncbi:MAG: hypothetical protein A2W19_02225 [Spirochaetes bacterium RBG_16_49_21]|nr:MAG: hypothetical protein A2W19_02225 [Spirochaetes bacterium RBG_16_49_21]